MKIVCFPVIFFTLHNFPRLLSSNDCQKESLGTMIDAKTYLSVVLTFCFSSSSEYVPFLFNFLEEELMLYTDGLSDRQMVPATLMVCSRGTHVRQPPAQNGMTLKTTMESWQKGCFLTFQNSAQLFSLEFLEIWETPFLGWVDGSFSYSQARGIIVPTISLEICQEVS